ncbi:hypothetical protein [Noviherbaspirillum pedocola]|uniref:Uncharacterized protein n=1 Tax=Noviherbaspirillum pedocola TaxID=2801341 RepID=A0A934T2T8_9BURK|nr:hypothetical protein [Noviherbaspirillum pedocola]MBK4738632.1 hypothetical protein [Noviherbaspirillum pedocola]
MTTYSVQQIKFECLSYIKEFGARMDQWVMGISSDPSQALARHGVDLSKDIWIWKPALSQSAARAVLDFFTKRYQVRAAETNTEQEAGSAHCVFMFKRQP